MKKSLILSISFIVSITFSFGQNYNKKFIKQVKKNLGKDAKHYVFLSYPVDNFGVLTFYKNSPEVNNQICSPFTCINMPMPSVGSDEWLNMYSYVSVGNGGSITLNKKQKKRIVVSTVLPKIYQAINLNAKVNASRMTNIDMSIEGIHVRVMEPLKIQKKFDSLPSGNSLLIDYINKNLVYVYSDYVVDKMVVSINIADTSNSEFAAALRSNPIGQTQEIDSSKANVSLSIQKEGSGTYTITFNHPVIIARSIKYQPTSGGFSATDYSFITKGVEDPSKIK